MKSKVKPRTEDRKKVLDWAKDLTQKEAAGRLGCSQQFLSHWLAYLRELGRGKDEHWAQVTGLGLRVFRMPKEIEG